MEWADWPVDHAPGEGARGSKEGRAIVGESRGPPTATALNPSRWCMGGLKVACAAAWSAAAQEWAELS